MSQHFIVCIKNKFTAGTFGAGGSFSAVMPGFPFVPDKWIVRSVMYDGTDNTTGPFLLSCTQLGGPLCIFGSSATVAATSICPQISNPGSVISNLNKTNLSGQSVDFVVSTTSATPTTALSGSLMVLLEFVKNAPKKSESKR
jgi:hypothetical protein